MMPLATSWNFQSVEDLFCMKFGDLLARAHLVHGENFSGDEDVQLSTLLSIKTGSCPENCRYCSQSAHYKTGLKNESMQDLSEVAAAIDKAKSSGSGRFCFAAAWRNVKDRHMDYIGEIIRLVKEAGLESCASLGMLTLEQAVRLKELGLDFYNHNIDTSREFYVNVATTRRYDDRLESVKNIASAGINVCSGVILGMGESLEDRVNMLLTLANLDVPPASIPVNRLVPIAGTPIGDDPNIGIRGLDFVRFIAVARIMFQKSMIRLAAGRADMSEELQALCFFAGANSIFFGEKLLTVPNADASEDKELLKRLGLVSSCGP